MKAAHRLAVLVIFSFVALAGCAQQLARSSSSASVTKMIEPVKDSQQVSRKAPLTIPVSVAIVTVPSNHPSVQQVPYTTLRLAAEKLKQQLLACPKYVTSVAVVHPDDVEGKISLERVRAVYAADVLIILSYQQDQRGDQNGMFGLMDATVVGAFLVPGVQIKTSSVIDGTVIHIPSSAIIFRASGTDERSSHSTSFAQNSSMREESINGILAATADFGRSLTKTLTRFDHYDLSQAVPVSLLAANAAAPANDYWKKIEPYKTTGGGAFNLLPLLISAAACCSAWWRK